MMMCTSFPSMLRLFHFSVHCHLVCGDRLGFLFILHCFSIFWGNSFFSLKFYVVAGMVCHLILEIRFFLQICMFSHGIFSIYTLDYNIYAIFYYKKAVLGRALIDIKIKRAFCVSLLFCLCNL